MKATFKDRSIYLSNELAKEAKIRKGSSIFLFGIKGRNTYGFHKGSKDMERSGILLCPVRNTPTGKLYVTPMAPPVDLITATMRLPNNRRATVRVKKSIIAKKSIVKKSIAKKSIVKKMNIFIFDV